MKLGREFMESEREVTRAVVVLTALEMETEVRKGEEGGEANVPL